MKLLGILDPAKQHPHQSTRERLRRLRQVEKGQLRLANGVTLDAMKHINYHTGYGGSLERLAAA